MKLGKNREIAFSYDLTDWALILRFWFEPVYRINDRKYWEFTIQLGPLFLYYFYDNLESIVESDTKE